MKNKLSILAILILLVYSSCQKQDIEKAALEDAPLKSAQTELKSAHVTKQAVLNFRAHLSGDQEVHFVETKATGQATFQLSRDGNTLTYRLIVANIENVRMAHIHVAPEGYNGPVVAWLYPAGPPPQLISGRFNGVLYTGTITTDDLVGDLDPEDGYELADLVKLMIDGKTYVNVHTLQYGAGEIRGQIFGNVK